MGALALTVLARPPAVAAHAIGGTFQLPVPLWLYLGAGIVVAVVNGALVLLLGPIIAFLGLSYMLASCFRDFAAQWADAGKTRAAAPAGVGED